MRSNFKFQNPLTNGTLGSNDNTALRVVTLSPTIMESEVQTVVTKKQTKVGLGPMAVAAFKGNLKELAFAGNISIEAARKYADGTNPNGETIVRLCGANPTFMSMFASVCGYADIAAAADYRAKLELIKEVVFL